MPLLLLWPPLAAAGTRLLLRKPSVATMDRYNAVHEGLPFNHDFAEATLSTNPSGQHPRLRAIEYRCSLGRGAACFRAATDALLGWEMHTGSGWCGVRTRGGRGDALCTYAAMAGSSLWVLNPCRVVYTQQQRRRASVAYATLAGHLIAGTERMEVEWRGDGTVEFTVLSLSRGAGPLGRLLFVGLARTQRRFFRDQLACMQRLSKG
jgi:uncharacterized protein (UPF0548 family)